MFKLKNLLYLFLFIFSSLNALGQNLTAKGKNGAVVSIDPYASKVGIDILKNGGNAIDAAIGTAFTLAVTHPFAGNIGGGGFMMVHLGNGETVSIDFREMAPANATKDMFLDAQGNVDIVSSRLGYLVAGVPGSVMGLYTAWKKYGKLPWKDLVQPAIALANKGVNLNPYDAAQLADKAHELKKYEATRKIYFKDNGEAYGPNDLLVQKDLSRTLRKIANGGAKAFYEGKIARQIVKDFRKNGGILTKDDLKNYEAIIRMPITGDYKGYQIMGMAPPSSGGVTIIEMLNILKNFQSESSEPFNVEFLQTMIEAMRHAFFDRTRYLGDADFVKIPIDTLTSEAYAKKVFSKMERSKAGNSELLFSDVEIFKENMETTHFSIADQFGNVVSVTTTLEEGFGSKAVVKGLGFLLNNQMHDFNIQPNKPNIKGIDGDPNIIEPGKRMLSSMAPTILMKDGKPIVATGSPGGRTILNTVLSIILGITDFNLTLRESIDQARISHHWMPDVVYYESQRLSGEILDLLEAMGYSMRALEFIGDANSIFIDPETGEITGEADDRRYGWAEAY